MGDRMRAATARGLSGCDAEASCRAQRMWRRGGGMTRGSPSLGGAGSRNGERVDHESQLASVHELSCHVEGLAGRDRSSGSSTSMRPPQ